MIYTVSIQEYIEENTYCYSTESDAVEQAALFTYGVCDSIIEEIPRAGFDLLYGGVDSENDWNFYRAPYWRFTVDLKDYRFRLEDEDRYPSQREVVTDSLSFMVTNKEGAQEYLKLSSYRYDVYEEWAVKYLRDKAPLFRDYWLGSIEQVKTEVRKFLDGDDFTLEEFYPMVVKGRNLSKYTTGPLFPSVAKKDSNFDEPIPFPERRK
jgi:hypothetical protein